MLDSAALAYISPRVKARFLEYVRVHTTSASESESSPSSTCQLELARLLAEELHELGLQAVTVSESGYVYATLPASSGVAAPPITFCAHMDTSPAVRGEGVAPILHENYDGRSLNFPRDPKLVLSPKESPELLKFMGQTLITASGDTLLGADDKAGLAEIMTALDALIRFPELPHPELRIVFTPDEEIGRGTAHIDANRLGRYGYTVDGGELGQLEAECFDAWSAHLIFAGYNIHPGYAKDKMVNAVAIASRFMAALPEAQTPEHTARREGFYHLSSLKGDESRAEATVYLRDYEAAANQDRIAFLRKQAGLFELRYPGLSIKLELTQQYRNMRTVLEQHPLVTELAQEAIVLAGVAVIEHAIRGGTDGASLCFLGMPTPNLFAGGLNFHSKTEWIPVIAMQKACEVILNLCLLWSKEGAEPGAA
ncbi:MAG: peptidase T [Desulfosarcinaceae bacterium]|jgi:tripeptide aminopeptidase